MVNFDFKANWTNMFMILAIASTPLTIVLLGPKVISRIGSAFGYYLRKKTAGSRAQILELVEAEGKGFQQEVETDTVGSAQNGGKADKEWDGIVGFFHPFW